ncbi:MAG: DUF6034 family protein [Caldicoprobacterales bacterium]|jgi:beta-lactamase regulating signal transducer with metallopeptidase domain
MPALLKVLFHISLMASLMIVVAIIIRRSMAKRISPAIMLILWGMVLLRLCLPFTVYSPVQIYELLPGTSTLEPSATDLANTNELYLDSTNMINRNISVYRQVSQTDNHKNLLPSSHEGKPLLKEVNQGAKKDNFSLWMIVSFIWITGTISILLATIRKAISFRRRLRFCKPITHKNIIQMKEDHMASVGIKKYIPLIECDFVKTPVVFGYFKPNILLPASFIENMNRDILNSILFHEVYHIKRHDILINYIWLLAKAIHWFNPLVWIAYSLYQEDVELYCDQMVVKHLSKCDPLIYGQSLIEAVRISKNTSIPIPSITTSLYRNKSRLKKRIVRIVKPEKNSKTLTCISIFLATLMLVMGFTTACQKTPDSPIVIGKDGSKLEEAIRSSKEGKERKDKTSLVERYTDSFAGADKKVTVNIDAEVIVPEGDVPVVEVKPYNIPMDQIKDITKVLFRGNVAYEPQIAMTKSQLEDKIIKLKKEMSNEAALLEGYGGNNEAVEEIKADYQQRIARYEEMYSIAPEKVTLKETDWNFHPQLYYMDKVEADASVRPEEDITAEQLYDAETFIAVTRIDDYHAMIQAYNHEKGNYHSHGVAFDMGSRMHDVNFATWDPADSRPMKMTKDQVIDMVENALIEMGIRNMRLDSIRAYGHYKDYYTPIPENSKAALSMAAGGGKRPNIPEPAEGEDVYTYSLTFVPTYGGVAIYNMERFTLGSHDDQFIHIYPHESLNVNVNNHMITYFSWSSPMEIVDVESDNVDVIDLEEAVAIFKKQMQLEYNIGKLSRYDPKHNDYNEVIKNIQSGEINITNIRLCLMRLLIKDRPGAYRMVPVWIFEGTEKLVGENLDILNKGYLSPVPGPGGDKSINTYAIINAIDGSIIDGNKGY